MNLALGIDIGGSGVKYSLADAEGRVAARHYDVLTRDVGADELLDRIASAAARLCREADGRVIGVGLAMPGHVDRQSFRLIDGGHNLPSLAERPLVPPLSEALALPVTVENDALAATIGEARFGAGRRCASFAMLTFGTGVGGGLVINGELIKGLGHQPPEFGAIVLDFDGVPNPYGQPGTLESLADRAGFEAAFAREGLEDRDIRLCFEKALSGHSGARRAIESVGRRVAQAVGTIANITGIRRCVIGGGIGGASSILLDAIRCAIPETTWPALASVLEIVPAETGNDAGTLGAAALVFTKQTEEAGP